MKICQRILPLSIITFYVMMMMKTHLPMDKAIFKAAYLPVDRVQYFLGFNQTWMMFSPNPSRLDSLVKGEVEFFDGTSVTFDFLEKDEKSLSYKYLKGEKLRKFSSENLRQDSNKYLWSDASDYVLRKVQQEVSKKAVKVSLIRYWNETPDWNKSFIKHGDWKENYQSHTFYSKKVD
jgi:hypothetical protein